MAIMAHVMVQVYIRGPRPYQLPLGPMVHAQQPISPRRACIGNIYPTLRYSDHFYIFNAKDGS